MRALILILNADPFATIRLPPLGFVDRSTRLRAQLMPPHACKHSTYTRHGDTKGPKGEGGGMGVARVERHGGAFGGPATPYGFQQLTARLINKVR